MPTGLQITFSGPVSRKHGIMKESKQRIREHDGVLGWVSRKHGIPKEGIVRKEVIIREHDGVSRPKIQRVPAYMGGRLEFEKFYLPKIISVSPIHWAKPKERLGEPYKLTWTSMYLRDANQTEEQLVERIFSHLDELKQLFSSDCWTGTGVDPSIGIDDRFISWMLMVDGCSVLRVLDHSVDPEQGLKVSVDQLLRVHQDLLLLENQIPFRVLKLLCDDEAKLKICMHNFLQFHGIAMASRARKKENTSTSGEWPKKHKVIVQAEDQDKEDPIHLLDYLRRALLMSDPMQVPGEIEINLESLQLREYWYGTVRELKEAGIGVKKHPNHSYFHPSFADGQLQLPELVVDGSTALIYLNLIAYEMCPDFRNNFEISSYIVFLSSLIDQPEDVKELVSAGVLINELANDKEVADLFKRIGTVSVPETARFAHIRYQIQLHFHSKRRKTPMLDWVGEACNTYFSTPWTIIAFLAAAFALVLTFIQTWYAVRPADSGLLVSVLRISRKALYSQGASRLQMSANFHYLVSIAIMLLCMDLYSVAHRPPVIKYSNERNILAVSEDEDNNGARTEAVYKSTSWHIVGRVKWYGFGIVLIFVVTFAIFPSSYITEHMPSQIFKYFYPTILLFTAYKMIDLAGKFKAEIARLFQTVIPVTNLTCLFGFANGFRTTILIKPVKALLNQVAAYFKDLLGSFYLVENKDGLGLRMQALQEAPLHPAVSVQNRREYFCGREEEENAILELLLNQKTGGKVQVINIMGEAGSGKTALAGLIYSNAWVIKSFQLRVWVTVPQKASICSMVKKILETVTEEQEFSQSNDLQLLQAKLEMCLAGKKFLLVLDNCWIEDDLGNWDKLISSLGSTGSAIILTASHVGVQDQVFVPPANHPVPLGLLATMDCCSIFWGHASVVKDRGLDEDPELKLVGLEIVKKLGNLPLAAKMIGSFLQDKDLDVWTQVLGDKLLNTRRHEKYNVPSFLILCYLDLPVALRPCFTYLSIFPRGYQFKRKEVVLLWMAQGFLCQSKPSSRSMEEVGNEYFSYLTWRSFFQRLGDRVSFVIHDLVHDLASYAFEESCEEYFSYYGSIEDFPGRVSNPHLLRSILPLGWACGQLDARELENKLSELNPHILRVLSLSHHCITELPPSIGELSHLRYLDLSYTALHALPDSIGDLYNLQTLLLTNCTSLSSLPERVSGLRNLRYLDIRGTGVKDMPLQMNKLTSLQTLTDFVVSRRSPGFVDLAGLSNIKTLAISNLHNMVDATDAFGAKLKEKKNLNDLMLQWGSGQDHNEIESEVLENLVPHEKIKNLTIENYCGAGFPSWLGDDLFQTLQSVKLCHCNCISLPPLGQLPGLKDLVIEGFNKVTHVGPEFCGRTGELKPFRSLESLHFREMKEWKEWKNVEDIEFQYLCELSIVCCPKLVEELPRKLGSLEKLEISGCYDLVASLPKMPPTCEVCVHDSNEILLRSVVEVPCRRLIVPVQGKEFTPQSYSSVPSTKKSHDESEETIQEPNVTPLDAQFPSAEADVPNTMLAGDPLVTDTTGATDYSQITTSSSEDERSSFEMLRVSNISQLDKKLPPKLDGLRIEECKYIEALPESLLPSMPTLQELYLIGCYSLKSFPPHGFLVSLRTLYISNCPKLELFSSSESTQKFECLKHLCIGSSCDSLKVFSLNFFPKLKTLCLWDCSNLASFKISEEFQGEHESLESLEIRDCPNLKSFPRGGLPTPNMASLLVSNCNILNNIPNSKNSLLSLQSLVLRECPALESSSLEALPSSLTLLSIAFCNKLTPHKSWGLHNLECLSSFEIEGGCIEMKSFPEEKLLPSNINSLRISSLQSLKKLDYKGFHHLNALQALEIDGCSQLQWLPEQGLPSSLTYLCIKQSPLLTQKLSNKAGEVWPKVAHIPHIIIDGKVIC